MSMLGELNSPDMDQRGMPGPRPTVSEYKLTWNNYSVSVASFIRLISPQEGIDSLSDVTVTCTGGKFYRAHRLVLATCSSYFRNIFFSPDKGMTMEQNGCFGYPIVVIPDVQSDVLELILAFMYKGEITVPSQLILPLMEAASVLGVQGLTEPLNNQQKAQPKQDDHQQMVGTPDPAVTEQQYVPPSLESQISQAFSRPLLKDSLQEANKKRGLAEFFVGNGQEPEDLSQTRKIIKSEQSDIISSHSEQEHYQSNESHVSFPQQSSYPPDATFNSNIFPPRHLKPPGGLIHNRRKSSPTRRCFKSSELSQIPATINHQPQQISNPCNIPEANTTTSNNPPTTSVLLNGHTSPPAPPDGGVSLAAATTMATLASSTTFNLSKSDDPSRPFACGVCPKRFRMKHHLKEHSLIHSGEMPYSCHLCPKRFNRSYTLKNHMKLHNPLTTNGTEQEQTTALPLTKRSNSS